MLLPVAVPNWSIKPGGSLVPMPGQGRGTRTRNPAPAGDLSVRLGALLRQARLAKGLSQAQLGAPHFTRAMVSAVELGKTSPSIKSLAFFAGKLEVRLRDLIPDD